MIKELITILKDEESSLKVLLELLEKQHKKIITKDIFGMEEVASEIQLANKEVAQHEVARRKLIGKESMKDIVKKSDNEALDAGYRSIRRTLEEIILQKDTNELLIKQNLSYTNKMLNLINPKRETNIYNSYGVIKR